MTERDKQEVGSKFWNEGKWDNFVAPLIGEGDHKGEMLIDMGCNAGLHVKMAYDMGFGKVVGIDDDEAAIARGRDYLVKSGHSPHCLAKAKMEESLNGLPVVDYTTLINSHYYFNVADWLEYLDALRFKTINCIIVTAKKNPVFDHVSSDVEEIRYYFKDWEEYGYVNMQPKHAPNDPHARDMSGLAFKSGLERVPIDSLDNGNRQQRGFLRDLDKGKGYKETEYYRRFYDYRVRREKWTERKLNEFFEDRVSLYQHVKDYGLLNPIVVKKSNMRIVDGNHRHDIWRHLGEKSIIVRWVL